MSGYRYRITVEPLEDTKGNAIEKEPLVFETENHDEILAIIERIQHHKEIEFTQQEAQTFALGLKLFSEVMMRYPKHPLLLSLREPWLTFMINVKKRLARTE